MLRVHVKPDMLRWARERAGIELGVLTGRFPNLPAWEHGQADPTLKQLEAFAKATHAPIGFLFLLAPPEERIPIPDFRTFAGTEPARPSPNLLDAMYVCQRRQAWYRDFATTIGEESRSFIGSLRLTSEIVDAAARIRDRLGFDIEARRDCPTFVDALRLFIGQADDAGILVMCSGVVLNNTHRRLDPSEFRGFAIADDLAPLVFINGADTKGAQMFTLAHELAHLWLGQSALSDADASELPRHEVERWCNEVAAEMLVPMATLRRELRPKGELADELQRLARHFKVSSLVILRRAFDAGMLPKAAFHEDYEAELARILALPSRSGGNFYLSQAARVSKRFARALVVSTLEGHTLYRDAYQMLGITKAETFDEFSRTLGHHV